MSNSILREKSLSAIDDLSSRLQVSKDTLTKTLKATIIKGKDGREATNEEFVSFIVVANQYKLNPLTKEIYAFPDKSGGIIPIVSTDGWNNLMTSHPDYKAHYYKESDKRITMNKAKPCPEWMEIHIIKKDDSEVVVREYLDECFRDLKYTNPWQTHTKRMLRHKTKIQGAREAFGFGGIYEEDEAERIVEMKGEAQEVGKPLVIETKSKAELEDENKVQEQEQANKAPEEQDTTPEKVEVVSDEERQERFNKMVKEFEILHKELGDKAYFETLVAYDVSSATKIPSFETGEKILHELYDKLAQKEQEAPKPQVKKKKKKKSDLGW